MSVDGWHPCSAAGAAARIRRTLIGRSLPQTCATRLAAPAASGGSGRTGLDSSSQRGCSPTAGNIHCFPPMVWLVTDASRRWWSPSQDSSPRAPSASSDAACLTTPLGQPLDRRWPRRVCVDAIRLRGACFGVRLSRDRNRRAGAPWRTMTDGLNGTRADQTST